MMPRLIVIKQLTKYLIFSVDECFYDTFFIAYIVATNEFPFSEKKMKDSVYLTDRKFTLKEYNEFISNTLSKDEKNCFLLNTELQLEEYLEIKDNTFQYQYNKVIIELLRKYLPEYFL